ncbi:ATP-binding protein [Fictibacillus terranigra]|uniref:histidine kinase n=1 Tax=Fictibacillus terranigra TaxID=3058424 RepID=A0ABT8ECR7_9BACL|nr:ATP-binding protein [Fictibacillus sp. CENA-BCM004]MDN4075721.1 ATP-binding protein [Fictibacillus sp. CENA-BCM004]
MKHFLQPLFVNIAVIYSLTYIGNTIAPFLMNRKMTLKAKLLYGGIAGVCALLCMAYPIETLRDSFFDLRNVPIVVVTLYAGWLPGAICTIVVSVARLLLGGQFAVIGVVLALVAYIIGAAYKGFFSGDKKKWRAAIVLGAVYTIIYMMIIHYEMDFLPGDFYLVYFICFHVSFFSTILLIERLAAINMRLEETAYLDKLSVVGQMAAAIAHEVRNPLTTVRGLIQFLAKDTEDKKLEEFAPLILDELDRTNKIITDYLTLVKPGKPNLKNLNLNVLIHDTLSLLRPYGYLHNTAILFKETGENEQIVADEQHVKQCLINIIKNAIESTEGKEGLITIYKHSISKDSITLAIEDNGKGMSEQELQQIGLPFYTTKTKGTGLGTMIISRLIRDIGGSVRYESRPEKGTKALLSLPLKSS